MIVPEQILKNYRCICFHESDLPKFRGGVSFEVSSSTEWDFPQTFSPNIFVDISKELSFKLKAMKSYKNELQEFPHPRSLESLEVIAKRWGTVCGFTAAEAFYLVRHMIKNIN